MKMDEVITPPLWVPVKDARRIASLGTTSIYKLIGNGTLRSIRVGGKRLVSYASLERLGSTPEVAA